MAGGQAAGGDLPQLGSGGSAEVRDLWAAAGEDTAGGWVQDRGEFSGQSRADPCCDSRGGYLSILYFFIEWFVLFKNIFFACFFYL